MSKPNVLPCCFGQEINKTCVRRKKRYNKKEGTLNMGERNENYITKET